MGIKNLLALLTYEIQYCNSSDDIDDNSVPVNTAAFANFDVSTFECHSCSSSCAVAFPK